VRIVVSTFYAMQDTRTPVKTATVSIAANILLGLLLMGPMKHCGLALATTLATVINLTLLIAVLRNKLGAIRWRLIFGSCLKTLIASGVMAAGVLLAIRIFVDGEMAGGGWPLLAGLCAAIGGGIVVYCLSAWVLDIPEFRKMTEVVNRRLHRS
jgi:putative peptidoglycan lipid II flippase